MLCLTLFELHFMHRVHLLLFSALLHTSNRRAEQKTLDNSVHLPTHFNMKSTYFVQGIVRPSQSSVSYNNKHCRLFFKKKKKKLDQLIVSKHAFSPRCCAHLSVRLSPGLVGLAQVETQPIPVFLVQTLDDVEGALAQSLTHGVKEHQDQVTDIAWGWQWE